MLHQIITGLERIHDQKLIHCDFHDGDIYGVIPFMAPEVLRGKQYTQAINNELSEKLDETVKSECVDCAVSFFDIEPDKN
ncbi:kinase-like domain-containing protein [Rhizophagus clarus]|uniref:Kinase-like domain-containing protein n=1 Tax=Rhizophagus clarus TaxID=94130 RepID=A0A8H3QHP7_9GLOM|nr:kinase-like domain-containing protein [Rhizophagus clarus]